MKQDIAVQLGIYALCVVLVSFLWPTPVVLLTFFLLISGAMLWRWHSRIDLAFYALAFVLGPTGEAIAVSNGAWEYSQPWVLVPVWLPFLWGIVALFMKRLAEAVVRLEPS